MNGLGQKRTQAAKDDEFRRKYHSVDRVLWVQRQPSVVSGKGPCVNAHVGVDGVGRKGGYETIVPLTREEHDSIEAPNGGILTFCARHGITLDQLREFAAETERRWQTYLTDGGPEW